VPIAKAATRLPGVLCLMAVATHIPLNAQGTEPLRIGSVTVSGSMRSRIESWDWFTAATGDHAYTFDGSTLRLGFSQTLPRFDWTFELEAPVLLNLPSNSVAPGAQGQLGQGASYYVANNRNSNAAMIFPKQAFIRWKLPGTGSHFLQTGRFEFQDGSELPSKDPSIGVLKRERIQQRLLGPFGFSHVMRSFDGLHYVYEKPNVNYTLIAAVPTRGVFQVDGWGWTRVAFSYAAMTHQIRERALTGEWRAFAIYYDDWRHVIKADNRAAAARANDLANIGIFTYGAHTIDLLKTTAGTLDFVGEFALQNGSWGSLQQRAGMVDLEGGFQPAILGRLKPWIRGGYYFGSGDKDPNDGKHGTFFQLLPTTRPYAQFPFYDMMNNVDRFAMLTLRPHKRITIKTEEHWLRLASRNDLWYAGGGVYQPWTFGYQTRPSNGGASLGNFFGGSVDTVVNPHLSISPYYGYVAGKSVIQAIYPKGKNGHLAFLELNYRF
jgi:Alginate export